MKNNEHFAKERFWLGHITLIHIHANYEQDFLNTSAAKSKTDFEKRAITHLDQRTVKILWQYVHSILKDARLFLATSKDMLHYNELLLL